MTAAGLDPKESWARLLHVRTPRQAAKQLSTSNITWGPFQRSDEAGTYPPIPLRQESYFIESIAVQSCTE